MSILTREEFLLHIEYVREDLSEVKRHLALLNGRTGRAEQALSVLDSKMTDAKVDIGELQKDVKDISRRATYISGGIAGVIGLAQYLFPWKPTP